MVDLRAWGGVVRSLSLEDVADKRLDVTSVISSAAVPFKIVLQKGLAY